MAPGRRREDGAVEADAAPAAGRPSRMPASSGGQRRRRDGARR